MADTIIVRGAGGTIFEFDVPAEGSHAFERFDAQLKSGELTEVRAEWVERVYGADKDGRPLVSRHLVEVTDESPVPAKKAARAKADDESAPDVPA